MVLPKDIKNLILSFTKKCNDCNIILIEDYTYYLSIKNNYICIKCRFNYKCCQMCQKLYKDSIYCKICDKVCKTLCPKCVINFFYNKIN